MGFHSSALAVPATIRVQRGLTSLELLIAIAITAMIGVALTGLMRAATMGVTQRRDNRLLTTRSSVFQGRLSAYVTPARDVLYPGPGVSSSYLVLWFNDVRQSETVHATEIRWLLFFPSPDPVNLPGAGRLEVHFVELPATMPASQKQLLDLEYSATVTDWMTVYEWYAGQNYLKSIILIDGLQSVAMAYDGPTGQVQVDLGYPDGGGYTIQWPMSATIRDVRPPLTL